MTAPRLPISRVEFTALCAMMFATIAFSIDAMLPALPEIGAELSPDNVNRAQLILTSFVLGMGVGTFFTGPLSDRFGRKPVVYAGAALYIGSAGLAWMAQSLELVLAARFLQGLGAAGPRVVTLAIIRDLVSGREMARMMSFAMMVFTLVPAIAPTLGAAIIAFTGWRGVFAAFMLFSLISVLWLHIRLPEPLAPENRRPFRPRLIVAALGEMWAIPAVRLPMMVQSLCFAMLFTMISTVQQVFDITFEQGASFPFWFGVIAIVAGSASLLNAALVMRLGMRVMVTVTLGAQMGLSGAMVLCWFVIPEMGVLFAVFLLWQATVFFQAGLTIGNLNAMAMEPLGHMAGTAASVMGAVSTVAGAALAVPVGLLFNGTPVPLALGLGVEAALGFALMMHLRRIEARDAKRAPVPAVGI
ncbi:MFS transporter, DHA1 family, bicyclomycin/chloramphenicol resistance protein [Salinihabitans flavidus]|uniref:MFS transporter, DHA1 family, bicyclomycin/chloramphenicol resistance protein n=1 Tax=Salinihabitans flavidus TaxID=569882 RepID=A0A1H8NI47_9RHOB|nr:multidrug effflux MFS transporter [Salinihabitans flavidus]SEO29275.1 MFS transporter, DHA1 family, bicyclomycin/chloramphenicol resistance protein [Salinihabitans flavidus]